MKLVGFGCSFTYGSELLEPGGSWDQHHANTRYREANCWLGVLAEMWSATHNNRAEPANSNYAIQYQFAQWFATRDPNEPTVVCVAWTDPSRFSWLDDRWYHSGEIRNSGEQHFKESRKDWVNSDVDNSVWTDSAKLFVNSVCTAHNIPILQFNALGEHGASQYTNYFGVINMRDFLVSEGTDMLASGGHPNEKGHRYFTKRLYDFAKERIIL